MRGARFYDSTAQAQRMLCRDSSAAEALESQLVESSSQRDRSLDSMLRGELLAQRKPRSKTKVRATDNGILKKAAGKDHDGPSRIAAEA
jgi:hypothetical protein